MKLSVIFFTIAMILNVAYAARIIRDVTPVPDGTAKTPTVEDVKKFFEDLATDLKAQVDKIATQENIDKVQEVMQNAMNVAAKGIQDIKSKADDAMKST